MRPRAGRLVRIAGVCALAALPVQISVAQVRFTPGAPAADAPVEAGATRGETGAVLKVCEDPNNMPLSSARHDGIENRIAELFAQDLHARLVYFDMPQRMNFVRNSLRFKLPSDDYRCDILLSTPVGFDQVAVTRPYYRSTYALVFAESGRFAGVRDAAGFLQRAREQDVRIGVFDRSPGANWLQKHELFDRAVVQRIMSPDPDAYPGQIIERDLAGGSIDAAIVWGPIAAYYARQVDDRSRMVVVPLKSEPGVRFDYAVAMGVRYGEPDWKKRVEQFIDTRRADIDRVLADFGVPLVDPADATPDRKDD